MKKTKLLSSFVALLFIFMVVGCSNSDPSSEENIDQNTGDTNHISSLIGNVVKNTNYYAESSYLCYWSDFYSSQPTGSVTLSLVQGFSNNMYVTEDALLFEFIDLLDSSYIYAELYVNDYENGIVNIYCPRNISSSLSDLYLDRFYQGTWQEYVNTLTLLEKYQYSFAVSETYSTSAYDYGDVELYSLDNSDRAIYETLINATIGNNYLWDSLFSDGGWDSYFYYPDLRSASDIYSYTAYESGSLSTGFIPIVEFGFDDGGQWYRYTSSGQYVYQEIMAFTDVYTSKAGSTQIPNEYSSYLI